MSHFLDRLTFFNRAGTSFSDGHGITTNEDRRWEDGYRKRWQHDKIVVPTMAPLQRLLCGRSTSRAASSPGRRSRPIIRARGLNCPTTSRAAVRAAPATPGISIRQPGEISAGALAPAQLWREARALRKPGGGWESSSRPEETRGLYRKARAGGFVRATWDEVTEIIAAANAYAVRKHGPDRVIGISPIRRCQWCPMPPARVISRCSAACACRSTTGTATCRRPARRPGASRPTCPRAPIGTIPNSSILWGSNVPQTRTPDAHFYTEARYRGAKSVVISPDYSEASKFADLWISVKQGTDAALGLAMGHVILREFYFDKTTSTSRTTSGNIPTCRCW